MNVNMEYKLLYYIKTQKGGQALVTGIFQGERELIGAAARTHFGKRSTQTMNLDVGHRGV